MLGTVLPSFERSNIVHSRVLRSRDLGGRGASEAEGGLGSRLRARPSCIVRLSNSSLVRDVMRAKRALENNYLTINNIKPELLGPEAASCVPKQKIFINEMLPQEKFLNFKNLRPIAQELGFKYVWHAGGRFLARRKGGERSHVFASAADLQAIQASYPCAHNQHLSNVETNVIQKKGGAAQANRSARSP